MALDRNPIMVSENPTTASVVLSIIENKPFNFLDFWLTSSTNLSTLSNVLIALITKIIKAITKIRIVIDYDALPEGRGDIFVAF